MANIITYPLNGITYDAEDAETYLCTRTSGVYSSDDMFQASVTDDREITISGGLAWIKNGEASGKSVYVDDSVAVTIPVADGTYPRVDRIVLQFSATTNASTIELLEGTPAASPAAPDITQTETIYQLGLCTVSVEASSVTVSASDITSTLLDEDVCGIMSDGVTGIPTATLQAAFMSWFESMKDQLSEDAAGNLQLEIDNLITYGTEFPDEGEEGQVFILIEE